MTFYTFFLSLSTLGADPLDLSVASPLDLESSSVILNKMSLNLLDQITFDKVCVKMCLLKIACTNIYDQTCSSLATYGNPNYST
jgi:hypothetical protein